MSDWFRLANEAEVSSPALLLYPDRIEENIRRMVRIAGNPARLRPHMKTHKLPEVIQLQLRHGITQFKCATIAEAEMTAAAGAADVLLAYPLVGPNLGRFLQLMRAFPRTRFATVADNEPLLETLSHAAVAAGVTVEVLVDVDAGMHRTGTAPGDGAIELYRRLASLPGLRPGGLHAYDGHLRAGDLAERARAVDAAFAAVDSRHAALRRAGLPVPRYVVSGTPSFPVHARRRADTELSPGTCVLWDAGYAKKCPDLDFLPAALVFTRVISKPGGNRLTLDLGHKAIAAENPHPRVIFFNLPDATAVMHSEEHLVIETPEAARWNIGDGLYGVPWHICPTVALHGEAVVVENGRAGARWRVVGRERRITI
jgi:D-serine deaminase-like pyridoxal phosphate-dependent protein